MSSSKCNEILTSGSKSQTQNVNYLQLDNSRESVFNGSTVPKRLQRRPRSFDFFERDNAGFLIPKRLPLMVRVNRKKAMLEKFRQATEKLKLLPRKEMMSSFLWIKYYIIKYMIPKQDPESHKSCSSFPWMKNQARDGSTRNREINISGLTNGSDTLIVNERGVYVLKDWTVVKKNDKVFITLMGKLIDSKTRKILNKSYKTGQVLKRLSGTQIRTIESDYILEGKFLDPQNKVPSLIKAHFAKNEFPENWRNLSRKWQTIHARLQNLSKNAEGGVERSYNNSDSSDEFEPVDEVLAGDNLGDSSVEEALTPCRSNGFRKSSKKTIEKTRPEVKKRGPTKKKSSNPVKSIEVPNIYQFNIQMAPQPSNTCSTNPVNENPDIHSQMARKSPPASAMFSVSNISEILHSDITQTTQEPQLQSELAVIAPALDNIPTASNEINASTKVIQRIRRGRQIRNKQLTIATMGPITRSKTFSLSFK